MKEQQIYLVKNSWKLFRASNPILAGEVFYSRLFLSVPEFRKILKVSKEEQSRKLIEMLNVIIGRLDKLEEIIKELKLLAVRHVDYGVEPEHYDEVENALLWMLEQGLGKYWNEEVKEAWINCFGHLSKKMMDAAGYTHMGK